jgi:DNA repair exonuclease SbcCD ATPase subunit
MIQFKKITVHNFGSYAHAELDLQNKGFCLVSGQNNYIKDGAASNGSGKSAIFSAICYALTGETVGGIRSGLKNINVEEADCWVELEFNYNKDHYVITRVLTPKTDMKIIKNDVDISGKGIRESEKKLAEVLPEITKDLITSTIIIGQGNVTRFSSFSPSGRKELLEKLTKSDFMIEDLKHRICNRQTELSTKIREYEDSLIANNTQLNISNNKLTGLRKELSERTMPDFNTILSQLNTDQSALVTQLDALKVESEALELQLQMMSDELVRLTEAKAAENAEELAMYNKKYSELSVEKNTITLRRNALLDEIKKLKAITDTCPTCGQKLPNIQKPGTAQQELEVQQLDEQLRVNTENFSKANAIHQQYLIEIDGRHKQKLDNANSNTANARAQLKVKREQENQLKYQLENVQAQINKQLYDQQHWAQYTNKLESDINAYEREVASITNIINITVGAKNELLEHLAVIKKMDTLVKRDFRGYLLANIIAYLDKKAKEFCMIVFGTDELSLSLNGNALDITYCGKMFDLLSGGEKQRVDLILQLAIRDMLITYLDLNANILVLDEITDFLDKKSCKAVMSLLESALQTVESVFIISHHDETLEIAADSSIQIVKNTHGISELLDY